MNYTILLLSLFVSFTTFGQKKTIAQIKTELESSPNPPLYVKDVLHKKFRMDTVAVLSNSHFQGLADSLAYHGKLKKVYGPYKGNVLLQTLAVIPTTFNHINQIFLDTSVFMRKFADSLANSIIDRISSGQTTFENMAQAYSMGGEAATGGDLGWMATGAMIPQIEKALAKCKKNELVKVWTASGLHIIRKTGNPVQGAGYALMMRIFL